tara:strand:+ start:601 stop:711 length:111 start_codon:yes stop_codon:yes gene_type:complete
MITLPDLIEKWQVWSLHYRTEIVWFVFGFLVGAILL